MKRMFISALICIALLFALSLPCDAATKTLVFNWGQTISADFGGWKLYKSTSPSVAVTPANLVATIPYAGVPSTIYTSATPLTFPDGTETTFYFVLTALDTNGNESGPSNEVLKLMDFLAPTAPSGLSVAVQLQPYKGEGDGTVFADEVKQRVEHPKAWGC